MNVTVNNLCNKTLGISSNKHGAGIAKPGMEKIVEQEIFVFRFITIIGKEFGIA